MGKWRFNSCLNTLNKTWQNNERQINEIEKEELLQALNYWEMTRVRLGTPNCNFNVSVIHDEIGEIYQLEDTTLLSDDSFLENKKISSK